MDRQHQSHPGMPPTVEIQERTARFRAVFERSRNAMFIVDDERRVRDVNEAGCQLLGAPRAWIVGRPVTEFVPPEAQAQFEELWQSLITEGLQPGEFEVKLPDGRRQAIEYCATANIVPGQHLAIICSPLAAGKLVVEAAEAIGPVSLTEREADVMALVALGRTTRQIAEELNISRETARTHTKHAMEKLGAHNRAHAVAVALSRGDLKLA